jgi:hypothetical protein
MKGLIRLVVAVFLFAALISLPLASADVMVQSSVSFTTTVDHKYIDICQIYENNCNNQEKYTPNNNASLGFTGTLTICPTYNSQYYNNNYYEYRDFLAICNPFNLTGNFTIYFISACNLEITLTHQTRFCNQSQTYTITNGTQISLHLYPSDDISYYLSASYDGQSLCNNNCCSAEIFLGFVPS